MKLHQKLSIPIVGILLIFLIIGSFITFLLIDKQLINGYLSHLETTTVLKKNIIHDLFSSMKEEAQYLAGNKVLGEYLTQKEHQNSQISEKEISEIFVDFLESHTDLLNINIADKDGYIISSYNINATSNEKYLGKSIETMLETNIDFLKNTEAFISDIIPVDNALEKESTNDYIYNQKKIYEEVSTFLFIVVPLEFHDTHYGFLSLEIDQSMINNILTERSGLGKSGETFIIGNDYLIRSDSRFIRNAKLNVSVETENTKSCFRNDKSLIEKTAFKDYRGIRVFGRFGYIEETQWCLFSEIDKQEVEEKIREVFYTSLISVFFMMILTYIIISISVKNITSPIIILRKNIEKFEQGSGNIKIDIGKNTDDEIGGLAVSFQKMIERIERAHNEVHDKVKSQTHEIQENKNHLEILNGELKKFQQAVDNASDFISIVTIENKVIYINKRIEEITGYFSSESIKRDSIVTWREKSHKDFLSELLQDISKNHKSTIAELSLVKKESGEPIITEAHITPILNKKGEVEFFLFIEHDVTKEKKIENTKNQFISIASHELRTPLTILNGYMELLLENETGPLNALQKKYVNRTLQNTQQLIQIVNDILDISKLESGKIEFHYEEVDILEGIQETVKNFKKKCEEKEIFIEVLGNPLIAKSDIGKIQQILTNLIGNSYKYTQKGGNILVSLKDNPETQDFSFTVKDSGIGIPEKEVPQVFEKFFQLNNNKKNEEKGTGLGLSICELIVEKMGGNIKVYSQQGKGTTVEVRLPKKPTE